MGKTAAQLVSEYHATKAKLRIEQDNHLAEIIEEALATPMDVREDERVYPACSIVGPALGGAGEYMAEVLAALALSDKQDTVNGLAMIIKTAMDRQADATRKEKAAQPASVIAVSADAQEVVRLREVIGNIYAETIKPFSEKAGGVRLSRIKQICAIAKAKTTAPEARQTVM